MAYISVNIHVHLLYLLLVFAVLNFTELHGAMLICFTQRNICQLNKKGTVQVVAIIVYSNELVLLRSVLRNYLVVVLNMCVISKLILI